MKRLISIMCIITATATLFGCDSSKTEKYIDSSSMDNSKVENYKTIDDNRTEYSMNAYNEFTFDGNYVYQIGNGSAYKGTLDNDMFKIACNVVGCKHNDEKCDGQKYKNWSGTYSYNGGLLYTKNDAICFTKDEKDTIVYKNDFTTTQAKENVENPKDISNIIFLNADKVAVSGYNFILIIDVKNNKLLNKIVCENGPLLSYAKYDDNTVFATNLSYELLRFDLKNNVCQKIIDKARDVSVYNKEIYYIDISNSAKNMYTLNCCDFEGKNTKKILDNCYMFSRIENNIFYQQWNKYNQVERFNLENNETKIILDEQSFNDMKFIYSVPSGFESSPYLFYTVSDAQPLKPNDDEGFIGIVVTDKNGDNPKYIPYERMG